MAKNRKSACPSDDCRAANPPQQEARARLGDAGVHADWTKSARRCAYCGCVYSIDGRAKIIRGYLDNEVLGLGWKPSDKRR
jgi:hypothetical protein